MFRAFNEQPSHQDGDRGQAGDEVIECPLCRNRFDPHGTNCHHGCPMGGHCNSVRCPGCGYEFVDTRQMASRIKKLTGWRRLFARAGSTPVVEADIAPNREGEST
ncbi:MAG: hypothetical protein U0527_08450 [Candidatus Eisenbacteria bacterium]